METSTPKPKFITFTGLDAKTDMDRVAALSARYPIEWGVLFSPNRQGREPRYPSLDLLPALKDVFRTSGNMALAAHLCGGYARRVLQRAPLGLDLDCFQRSQINCVEPDADAIYEFSQRYGLKAITQHRTLRYPEDDRIQWLFDKSGGRGESPKSWPIHPEEGRMVGYAGGFSPDNIAEKNAEINAKGDYWLDMESNVRTHDWLDLDKCEKVCSEIFD